MSTGLSRTALLIKHKKCSEDDAEDLSKCEIEIISHYDEPQGDPSQIGQSKYLLNKFMVTVISADSLF